MVLVIFSVSLTVVIITVNLNSIDLVHAVFPAVSHQPLKSMSP